MKNTIDIIKNYRPLSKFQTFRTFLQSAYLSATDYHDGKHYALLTDLTSIPALVSIQHKMRHDDVGKLILFEKPRVKNDTLNRIAHLPENTFGLDFLLLVSNAYYRFMTNNEFKPEERPLVNHIPDLQLAYISQRYKQIHDFIHVLLQDFITVKNQLLIKWFEMIQLGLPAASLAALMAPLLEKDINLSELASFCHKAEKCRFVMNVYFQKHFEQNLKDFRRNLNLQ